jgi:uncharacterized protein YggE
MPIFRFATVSSGALLALSLSAGCGPHQHKLLVEAPSGSAPTRGITVSGVGKASGKPNIARSTVGVEARAGSAEEAIAEVNRRMAQVIGAIKQAGVAEQDIRTASLSLNFERVYDPRPVEVAPTMAPTMAPAAGPVSAPGGKAKPASPPKPESAPAPPSVKLPQGFYNASNSVEVTIRNLEQAGKVLSAATAAGADQLYGIRFEIEDLAPLQTEARKHAVEDAKARAERLAQLAGVKLGPAVSIIELDGGGGGPVMPMMAMAKSSANMPVESGELTISTTVQIVYALPE